MLGLHIHRLFHILGHVLVAMVVIVVTMVVAINIVAVVFHHVPVLLPVHHVLILDIRGHMFDHVTSLMCKHVLFQSVAPIFVQMAVVFSTVFVQVIIAVWLITIAIMRIAIMARVGIPMPFNIGSIHVKVMMTINLMARVIMNTATMVTILVVVVLDHNFFHLLVGLLAVDVVVAVILLSDVAVMLIMIFVVAAR